MWESASVPELGKHPQHILNERIIADSDLLVAIFWSKLGTPTPTASSGTAEEIREFISKKGAARVMLYFCTRDLPHNIDAAGLVKLREFKEQMRTQGLFQEFKSLNEFERDLYFHLDAKVQELLQGKLPLPSPKDRDLRTGPRDPPADPRLNALINLGTTLQQISKAFTARMNQFKAIDGVSPDKFYALGAHVYESAATCIDQFLTYNSHDLPFEAHAAIDKISSRLKRLAAGIPDADAPFPQYWDDGDEVAKDLAAQVRLIERRQKQ
jgi:hypothetical protein